MWQREAVLYQIYPLSFQDSNGDGKGDLPGLVSRLDHVSWLGVDALWLGPIYRSPMRDFGFDVSDFTDVDPVFGTLDDFDRLVDDVHRRALRLVLDFVPNHTSDEHPWFVESRASRSSAKRDWYVWRDGARDGGPPNNWTSRFGGSAWTLDPRTGQYYYHAFLREQPDLNWRNADVRGAMADALRFWLRRGVDGFRIDAAAVLAEDERLRDDPPRAEPDANAIPPERLERKYTNYRPEVLDWLAELRRVVDEFPGRMLLGEVDTRRDSIRDFYGTRERPILHAPLVYRLLETDWNAQRLADEIGVYVGDVPDDAWPVWAIGSHDKYRIATHVGERQARNAALLAHTLRGVPIFFAGDEIGMHNVPIPPGEARDPFERCVPGYGLDRDVERTPMQWDASRNGGFTRGVPWLSLARDYGERNVERERGDARSLLHFYRDVIALRRAQRPLLHGSLDGVRADGDVLSFARAHEGERVAVVANVGGARVRASLAARGRVLLSTHRSATGERVATTIDLGADEGVVVALD